MKISSEQTDVYSQFGEDGIIKAILSTLPSRDSWCVEFGAWDGIHLSNTCRLIREEGYCSVMIEGDPAKASALKANYSQFANVHCLQRWVGFGDDSIDSILSETPIPQNFDFISIDIDSCDFHIWESIVRYRPKLVCIEFNPTVAIGVDYVQEKSFRAVGGTSLHSLIGLARTKGYELVATTQNNGFFIESGLFTLFDIDDNSETALRKDLTWVSHIMATYDGGFVISGYQGNPWNGLSAPRMLGSLPAFLRFFPSPTANWKCKALGLWKKVFRLNHTPQPAPNGAPPKQPKPNSD